MPFKEKSSARHKRVKRTVASVKSISNAHEFPSFDRKIRHLQRFFPNQVRRQRKKLKSKGSIPEWKKITKDHKKSRDILAARLKKLRKNPKAKAAIKKYIKSSMQRASRRGTIR